LPVPVVPAVLELPALPVVPALPLPAEPVVPAFDPPVPGVGSEVGDVHCVSESNPPKHALTRTNLDRCMATPRGGFEGPETPPDARATISDDACRCIKLRLSRAGPVFFRIDHDASSRALPKRPIRKGCLETRRNRAQSLM
jgi:hypothetical protein